MKTITAECKIEITKDLLDDIFNKIDFDDVLKWFKKDYIKLNYIHEYVDILKNELKELGELDE